MSLDGLRAWIGLVERKLTMRTRVFLVLLAIAIGAAGAALYLAIDAQDSGVSESELQSVREELAGAGGELGGGEVAELEAEIEALRGEVATLRSEAASDSDSKEGGAAQGRGSGGDAGASGGTGDAATGGAVAPKNQQQLEELVEKAEQEGDDGH